MQDSQGRLCSQRRAPRPASASAQRLCSGRPGGTAASLGASAGLCGTAACSEESRETQSPSHALLQNLQCQYVSSHEDLGKDATILSFGRLIEWVQLH